MRRLLIFVYLKHHKTSTMSRIKLIVTTIITFVVAYSCAKQMNCTNLSGTSFDVYLELSTYDVPYLLPKRDLKVLDEALKRFGFFEDNNRLNFRATSPESINISPKLYYYITALVEKGNDPLTKSSQPTDCVARALAMWGGYSYSDINYYIITHYGNAGVLKEDVFSVIRHFYPSATQCTPDSLPADYAPNVMTTMGYFETGETGNAHMVNISSIDSLGFVTYFDAQNIIINSLPLSSFEMIYIK